MTKLSSPLDLYFADRRLHHYRGGNQTGQVGFGFGSDGSGQFDFLEEIGSGQGRVGSGQFIYCVFSDR
jgi:hypothetical protein